MHGVRIGAFDASAVRGGAAVRRTPEIAPHVRNGTAGGVPMRALAPWNGMTSLRKEMDRVLDRFWDDEPQFPSIGEWKPLLDVTDNKDFLLVRVEIPGIEAKDVKISFQDQMLTIEGEKKVEMEEKDERHYKMERSYGTFVRSIRLPVAVDVNKVNAALKNGVLTIELPKMPAAKGTIIPVKPE
jgi:HSP20 family protein